MARELFARNWDQMSFDEQREYRDRKLSYFVRTQLYPYSAYYRRLFDDNNLKPEDVRKVEDLRKLPFTYKEDIAPDADMPRRFEDFILQPDEDLISEYMPSGQRARLALDRLFKGSEYAEKRLWKKYSPIHMEFTTGRTGLPTPILYARDDLARMTEAGRRILQLVGFGTVVGLREARVVNAMPFAPHLAFWMVVSGLQESGILSLHTGGGRILGTQRIISAVQSMNATGVVGMPGYTYRVLRRAAEQGADFSSVKVVLMAGERIPRGMKDKMGGFLEETGAKDFHILGAYGFTEGRKSYSECVPDGDTGYHVYPDLDYVEIVDPESGDPVDEGEDGELVYTCLEGQGTCVLRFRTGDYVRGGIVYEPCPSCGRLVPRFGADITRAEGVKEHALTKLKGTLVDQGAFFSALQDNPKIAEWQVELKKPGGDPYEVDVVEVYIAPTGDADVDALKSEVESSLQIFTEVKPDAVNFMSVEQLVEKLRADGGMKELRVVDRRPQL